MMQTVSKRSRSTAVHYGLTLAKRNFRYSLLSLCMYLLGLPMMLTAALAEISSNGNEYESVTDYLSEIYYMIAYVGGIIALFAVMYIAMSSFVHLYDKRYSDMEYSLPMTSGKRYLAGYFSGLALFGLPYILSQLITAVLMLIGINTVDPNRADGKAIFAEFVPICTEAAVGGFIILLMFYTMFVMTMTFCGTKFEASLYGIGANFCMPVLYYGIEWVLTNDGYGLITESNADIFINRLFSCTSPIGAGFGLYMLVGYPQTIVYVNGEPPEVEYPFFSLYSFGGWTVKCLLFTALLFLIAFMRYRRRTAEQTGMSFISKPLYYGVMCFLMGAVCFIMINSNSEIGVLPMVVVTLAVFVIIDCIANKGIQKLLRSLIKYGAVMAAIVSVYFVSVKAFDVFAVNNVPEASEIECAELSMDFSDSSCSHSYCFYGEENIQTVIDAQAEQLRVYNDRSEDIISVNFFAIKYTYKNGKEMERLYWNVYETAYGMLLPLEVTDEVKEQKISALTNTMTNGEYRLITGSDIAGDRKEYLSEDKELFTEGFTSGLIESMTEDINSLTLEELNRFEENSDSVTLNPVLPDNSASLDEYLMKGPVYFSYTFTGAYKNTLAYLSSHGISAEGAEYTPETIKERGVIEIGKAVGHNSIPVKYCTSETLAVFYDPEKYSTDDTGFKKTAYDDMSEGELKELAEICSGAIEYYIPEGECYTISIDGTNKMYIPKRYGDIVESIIS